MNFGRCRGHLPLMPLDLLVVNSVFNVKVLMVACVEQRVLFCEVMQFFSDRRNPKSVAELLRMTGTSWLNLVIP